MDLRRFLDLYVAESQEHLRGLHRSLLALESDDTGAAVDEAFRAAHTLKGISAAMGYGAVAEHAHALEDSLDGVRKRGTRADPALIDQLLASADRLEREVAEAVATIAPQLDGGPAAATPAAAPSAPRAALAVPAECAQVLVVTLAPDAPVKAARALLVLRGLLGKPGVAGAVPDPQAADFDGTLYVFLESAADAETLRASAAGAGDVISATLEPPAAFAAPAAARPAPAAPAAPAQAAAARQVRVEEARLDSLAEGIGELSVLKNRLVGAGSHGVQAAAMIDRMGGLLADLQLAVLEMRMVPLSEAFERLPRVVRDAARRTGKQVDLVIDGEEIELDRAILNEIGDPLVHLLRNAVDHGIEDAAGRVQAGKAARGTIRIQAERERSSIRIVLEDDGAGVDRDRVVAKARGAGLLPAGASAAIADDELFRLLSHPGFSTAEQVTDVSGRGVGLDAVVNRVRALGGAVEMHSVRGTGTTFAIRLPITLALAQALRVRVGGEDYAIPLTHVAEALVLNGAVVEEDGRELVRLREQLLPLVRLRQVLGVPQEGRERAAVIAEFGDRRAALAVDELVGHEQILVKSFDPAPGMLSVFSGATLLDDGRPALVLDPLSVI